MSIEGNVLSNSFANATAENMYNASLANRDNLPLTDAEAVSQMQNMLNTNTPSETQKIEAVSQTAPGDEILNSLQKISDFQNNSVQTLAENTKNMSQEGQLSMAGLLEAQTKLMEFQLKQELISKASGSISQGVQTLFKNQ